MENMKDIFTALVERNVCGPDISEFETQWLGVGVRYLQVYGEPSLPASIRLYVRLTESGPAQGDLSAIVWRRIVGQLAIKRKPRTYNIKPKETNENSSRQVEYHDDTENP